MNVLRKTDWSPYAAGALLGVTAAVSIAGYGKRLSGAGAYQHLAALAGRLVVPGSVYFRDVMPGGMTWEMWIAVGTFLGAFVSAVLGGTFRLRMMPDSQWADVFGPTVAVRWALVFAGTLIIELAASVAGGCTASLAVSGGAAAAPGAFLFMAGMFLGGIPVARLLYRGRR